ncbi:MAG: hypothetical protein J6Z27_01195 [Bacteroidales bacterium]|nr:hypothetical protein [Bacteroidales bacterium]
MKKIILLLAVCLLQVSAFGAVKTTVTAPSAVTVKVFVGFANDEAVVEPASATTKGAVTTYVYNLDPGIYHFNSTGEGYFSLRKNFTVGNQEKKIDANPGRKFGNGYEYNGMVSAYTDECAATALSTVALQKKYKNALLTPAFTLKKEGESYTSQAEMEAFLGKLDDTKDNMYLYVPGHTILGKNMPLAVFSTTNLTGMSMEQAAAAVRANGKPTVFLHALIHGNEPSAGEGALAMISELDSNLGKQVLPKVNVIVMPRVNGDGIEAWTRGTTGAPDLNRDNVLVKNPEMKATHLVYNLFLPEVVIDMHEYGVGRNFRETEGYLDDAGITVSGNQNNTKALNDLMLEMMRGAEKYALDVEGIRLWEYTQGGYSDQSPLHASHYYALRGSTNFLVETPNAGCEKKSTFARRVFTQFIVAKYMIDFAIENADRLKRICEADRASTAADGEIYNDENPIILKHGQNEESYTYPRSQFNYITGQVSKDTTFSLRYYEVPLITRNRPTAYVIPKNLPNIAKILEVAYYNGITCYELAPGQALPLRKYVGNGQEANLCPEQTYLFSSGAYVFPMNQGSGIVLAMLMEPDFRMTDRNPISLVQAEYLSIDEVYRSERDLNARGQLSVPKIDIVK